MRRLVSLPPVATLTEPNDSEGDDEDDENDELASNPGSHITRSSVSAASGAIGSALPVANATDSQTNFANGPPPSTQPAPLGFNLGGRSRLALLNKPGKGQTQTPGAGPSGSGSGTGMPPPSQSASQMARERVASSSSAQPTETRSERDTFSVSRNPMRSQPIVSSGSSRGVFSSGTPGSPNKTSASLIAPGPSSSSRHPPASQPQPRPRLSNSISAPSLTQPSKSSSTGGSNKGKGKETLIEILSSDDDTMGASQTVPPRPKPRKKTDSVDKSALQSKATQKRNSFENTLSTSSGDEFPFSLSQTVRRPGRNYSPGKPPSSTSTTSLRERKGRIEYSDDDAMSSISQAPRKRVPDDQRATQSGPVSRDRPEKNKAAPKSPSKASSTPTGSSTLSQKAPQSAAPPPRIARIARKSTGGPPAPSSSNSGRNGSTTASRTPVIAKRKVSISSQPTSNRAGPLSSPSSAKTSGQPSRPSTLTSRPFPHSSPSKPRGPTKFLGVVEISTDEEDDRPSKKGAQSEILIDLTLDDDDDNTLPVSIPSLKPATPPRPSSSNAQVSAQTDTSKKGPPNGVLPGSPPIVRPKPRVSAIPKEKMAAPKPQPAQSRPLDMSRRRSDGAADGDGNMSSHSWLLDSNSSEPELAQPKDKDARAIGVASPADIGQAVKEQTRVTTARQGSPSEASVPGREESSLPVHNIDGLEDAEPKFDGDIDEAMDIFPLYDDDGPGEDAPTMASPSGDTTAQAVAPASPPERPVDGDAAKKPEETSAPIERARELRSPPATEQANETQTQSEDANEVDLLLGPPSNHARISDDVEAENPGGPQLTASLSSTGEVSKKPETLTDKLELLDLSRPTNVPSDVQGQQVDPDVQMEGDKVPGVSESSEGLSAPLEVPTSQVGIAFAASPLAKVTSEEEKSDRTEGGGNTAASSNIVPSSTPELAPRTVTTSPPSPEKSTRAVSPGILQLPEPTPGLVGAFYGENTPSETSSSQQCKLPVETIGDKLMESSQRKVPELVSTEADPMALDGNVKSAASTEKTSPTPGEATSELASKAGETRALGGSPIVDREESSTPTSASSVDSRSTNPLSPKSRAKMRIPDPRPPRKLRIGQPVTLAQLRAEAREKSSRSSPSSTPPPGSGLRSSDDPQQSTTESAVQSSPEAIASARRLAERHPLFVELAKASANSISTMNASPKADSSSLVSDQGSMRYVENVMMRHTSESSTSGSSVNGTSPLLRRAEPANAYQPTSPKRQKTSHAPESQRTGQPASVAISPVSSGKIKAVPEIISLSDSSESADVRAPSNGPDIIAAPHIRHQVARKSAPKRRPKVIISTSDPAVRSIEQSMKETSLSTSISEGQPRKRTLSSLSRVSSIDDDEGNVSYRRRVTFKRRRIQDSDEEGSSSKELRRPLRQSRRTSRVSADEGLSSCSVDPIDLIDTDDEDSDSSAVQPTTPVAGLAGAVRDFSISKDPDYCGGDEVGRYFMDRGRGPVWYHVDDIPRELIDEVNGTPDWCKNPMLLRQIFEAAMMENTISDEADAPLIKIINNIDDEPTPPFEFYYTNRIYHGHGVPPPEYRTLQGCNCVGRCNPLSEKCACAIRQRKIFEEQGFDQKGFAYDDKGRLQLEGFPIFECNDACGCTEDCTNRVVQLGRQCHVNIVKTKNKGWGVFSGRKIFKGTFIGIYSGEILLHSESVTRGLVYNKISKTYLFDIDFYHIKAEDQDAKYTMDAYHVGNFTRFLNHSCDPNCRINAVHINDANIEKALLGIFAIKDIDPGQELTFNYYGEMDEEDMDKQEDQSYQQCLCGARNCVGKLFTFSNAPTE